MNLTETSRHLAERNRQNQKEDREKEARQLNLIIKGLPENKDEKMHLIMKEIDGDNLNIYLTLFKEIEL